MIPDLRLLRYFIAVAEELHFTRAARRLHIAQPPLSQQIRQLERDVGVPLLVRTTRRVELTPAGEAFLAGARSTLAEAASSVEAAQRASRGEVTTVRIGFTDSAALSILPEVVRRFRRECPHIHLDLHEEASARQVEAVRRGTIDIALVRGPLVERALRTEVVFDEGFSVALRGDHPLASRARVPLRLLAGEPLVLFPRHLAPAFHDMLSGMCYHAGFAPVVAYEAAQYQTILSLVAAELGVSIVPTSVQALGRAQVVFRPLTGTAARAQVVAVLRREHTSGAVETLLAALQRPVRAQSRARKS